MDKEKKRIASHNWYIKNIQHKKEYTDKYLNAIRRSTLTHYGNGKLACVQCGEDRLACLTIDHINNNGNKDRRHHKLYGTNFYKMLRRTHFPLEYQTLCMNCQFVKMHDFNEARKKLGKE